MGELMCGDKAPAFSLPADDGGIVSLDTLIGNAVVLFFYPKDDTKGCTTEAVSFSALVTAFDAAGVRVVGISPDSLASHLKFKAKHGLTMPLVADPDRQAISAYGVWVEKSMYGRRYMGVERSTFLIDAQGRVARIWRKVRVTGHAEEVLEAAKSL